MLDDYKRMNLLIKINIEEPFIEEILNQLSESSIVLFYTPRSPQLPERDHILQVYQNRYDIQVNILNPTSHGFGPLLHALETTQIDYVCISIFQFDHAAYTVFSNEEKTELIGVLRADKGVTFEVTSDWLVIR